MDFSKAIFRGITAAGLLLAAGSMAFAQSDANAAATTTSTKLVTAVGTLTVTPATSCINVTCPEIDPAGCTSEVLTGTSKNFNRFGGFKSNSQLVLCETIDTTIRSTLINGCAPAAGIGVLTSANNTITFALPGESCTLPGATTGFEAFNQVGAITNSTSSKIASGGGSFNSWDNGSTGSFNLSANYSK